MQVPPFHNVLGERRMNLLQNTAWMKSFGRMVPTAAILLLSGGLIYQMPEQLLFH